MDRFRQKTKKDKPIKYADKEKPAMFVTDVKSIKENLKIKEILRTVKMNSSMRIKAPRGSKVMQNKDFNDNDDFEDGRHIESGDNVSQESTSATNPVLMNENLEALQLTSDNCVNNNEHATNEKTKEIESKRSSNESQSSDEETVVNTSEGGVVASVPEDNISQNDTTDSNIRNIDSDTNTESPLVNNISSYNSDTHPRLKPRERKYSLDHTMLTRCQSLSQSEMDLNSIGKSPLERKSSFFRKKMDSFFKNTTKIFKKQSLVGDSPSNIVRRGSMSVSLQSLNDKNSSENFTCSSDTLNNQGSTNSLQSSRAGQSVSSLSVSQSEQERLSPTPDNQQNLTGHPAEELSTGSVNSLNETFAAQGLLNARAISMSSGLDTAVNRRSKRKTSWANRVTWLASETLANHFRLMKPEDYNKDMAHCHSYQDLSSIPEINLHSPDIDSKGRRLSYQRAVSGEDPVLPTRFQDSNLRKRQQIPEDSEADYELANLLGEFTNNGVPPLKGYCINTISEEAYGYLLWAERIQNLEEHYDCKKLSQNEEARQAVIRELVNTEADYIRHLMAIVDVFIAAAHALQDAGKLLEVDTERLFSNIPDIVNASLYFWDVAICPMIVDAVKKAKPFDTLNMSTGFMRFRELFQPYEKYVCGQTKALDYLRSLTTNSEFMMYLTWCHGQKSCNRLQLSDMLVKPMQRLTKYALILRRIIAHTEDQPERIYLIAMESCSKNYVLDLNRAIRQREELEKLDALANSLDTYELDFKDEEMDKHFRAFAQLNLRAPMIGCVPTHSRCLIHQGDLRFKDHNNLKEIEVRVFLLTDMLLVCKKLSKGSIYQFKMIRPKIMVDKLFMFPKYKDKSRELYSLLFIIVDDVGSATYGFSFAESPKDPNSQGALKLWESKVKEAKLSYDLGVWFAKNPSRDLSEVELDSSSEYPVSGGSAKPSSDDINIEREARERVAVMLHRSMGHSTEYDYSQASMNTDSFDGSAVRSGAPSLRYPMQRNSTGGSSRNSRVSSFQQSTSAASHDEPQPGPSRQGQNYRPASSVEHLAPGYNPEEGNITTVQSTITVNVVSESESETMVPGTQQTSPSLSKLTPRSPGSPSSYNTLHVQPQCVMALVHSLPDLTVDPSPPRAQQNPTPQSASEKLYQSHQELLHRNRLSAQHHQYLTPDHRGTSYPPPSPTRASLKRGLAFSYSFKNPPLSKMGHVNSQSQLHNEAGPSSRSERNSPHGSPSISSDKADKKKQVNTRNKSGGSASPGRKDDKND